MVVYYVRPHQKYLMLHYSGAIYFANNRDNYIHFKQKLEILSCKFKYWDFIIIEFKEKRLIFKINI